MERQVEGQTEGQTEGGGAGRLPPRAPLDLAPALGLRYGENPHQPAGFYVQQGDAREGMADCRQLQGKELSYNNLLDSDAAARVAWQFADPACVIVKHNSPCGMALGATAEEAFRKAYDCDPTSAFGGIAAFNRPMDAETAAAMLPTFWEVILAPGFSDEALQAFAAKKQLRLLATQGCWPLGAHGLEVRSIGGGYLLQRPDSGFAPVDQWETMVAGASPKPPERDLFLAQMAAKALKSNSIAIAKGGGTVGVGAGQTSRVESVEIACRKAGARARGAALGSDAFFPFADGIEMAAAYGVSAVIEPGGSLRDGEVVDAARRLGLWLFFTGMRHFRH
jgi:phosphoribosylaminoimidazolecarboxamide formyltransferase/IMP cyclohydrolase